MKLCNVLLIVCFTILINVNTSIAEIDAPPEEDITFAHNYFHCYTDYFIAFHSFFNKNDPSEYSLLTINDWNDEYEKFKAIDKSLKKLPPPETFKETYKEFMQIYNNFIASWEEFITTQEEDVIRYPVDQFVLDVATDRIEISRAYANIYYIYSAWPEESRNKVNTEDLMEKWFKMEELKKGIINRRLNNK